LKEALNGLVFHVLAKEKIRDPLGHQKEALVHLIHVHEGPNPTLLGHDNRNYLFQSWTYIDPLEVSIKPITRAKRLKETLIGLVQLIRSKMDL
jgi:hypothetical protein